MSWFHDHAKARFVCLKVILTEAAYCLLILRKTCDKKVFGVQILNFSFFFLINLLCVSCNIMRREKNSGNFECL